MKPFRWIIVGLLLWEVSWVHGNPEPERGAAVFGAGVHALTLFPDRGKPRVDLLFEGTPDKRDLDRLGVRVHTRAGSVFTATAPVTALGELRRLPGLRRAVLARPMNRQLDASVPSVGASTVRFRENDAWSGLTGDGVVIGLVDSGLDWTHEDFRHPDGSTRIAFYWDQGDPTGTPPLTGMGDTLYTYGSEWTDAQIDGGNGGRGDLVGHGTHVTGIAAGDGSAAPHDSLRYRYAGVAPEATIIVVAADLLLETSVLDGVNYVFEKAAELGMPAVVNLSLGNNFGPHDGTTLFEIAVDNLVGPGRVVVASAGNAGDTRIHAEIHVPGGGRDSASVFVPPYTPGPSGNFFVVDTFYYRPDSMAVTVVTPSGHRVGPHGLGSSIIDVTPAEGTVTLNHLVSDPASGNLQMQFDVSDITPDTSAGTPPAWGEWMLVFEDLAGSPAGGEVDLWMAHSSIRGNIGGRQPYWIRGLDRHEEIGVPATGNRVIAVGSYNTKQCWPDPKGMTLCSTAPDSLSLPERLHNFTSRGPTRDGRQKPELTAPGFIVSSSLSKQMTAESQIGFRIAETADPDGEHFVFAGTSMSAPHVSGAAALLLEDDPALTPEEFRIRLVSTARKDFFTGPDWTPNGGHGKLDVAALTDTVTSVIVREIEFSRSVEGFPRLEWRAETRDPVTGFELKRIPRGEPETSVGIFPGPGPHHWVDMAAESEVRYLLLARLRDGRVETWAEAVWTGGSSGPRLGAIQPNPGRGEVRIRLVAEPPPPDLNAHVVDVGGRRLAGLGQAGFVLDGGWLLWDGKTAAGEPAPAGVYWMVVRTGEWSAARKLIRLP